MFIGKKIYYRTRQCIFSVFLQFGPIRDAEVVRGAGSITKIPAMVKKNGQKKVLVVTMQNLIDVGLLDKLTTSLKEEGIGYTVFTDVTPDPTTDSIEAAVEVYKKEDAQAIIALGGGSVIDCSKGLAARIARPNKTLAQMQGLLRVMKRIPDIYAVPTTAGTGSEATAGAVITDSKNQYKYTILDLCLIPRYAILDPELTRSLPNFITSVTGIDALSHAVEAYTNRFCFRKVRQVSLTSTKLVYENLYKAYEDGSDMEARENMSMASYLGGIALTKNYIGYVHAIAHGIGGLYHLPHGKAIGIVMPYVLEAFGEASYKQLAELAEAAGVGTSCATQEEKAKAFIESLRELNRKMEIPDYVEQLEEKDIPTLVERAVKEANPNYPAAVLWEAADFERVIRKMLKK